MMSNSLNFPVNQSLALNLGINMKAYVNEIFGLIELLEFSNVCDASKTNLLLVTPYAVALVTEMPELETLS